MNALQIVILRCIRCLLSNHQAVLAVRCVLCLTAPKPHWLDGLLCTDAGRLCEKPCATARYARSVVRRDGDPVGWPFRKALRAERGDFGGERGDGGILPLTCGTSVSFILM
jgi:hypothetical protein